MTFISFLSVHVGLASLTYPRQTQPLLQVSLDVPKIKTEMTYQLKSLTPLSHRAPQTITKYFIPDNLLNITNTAFV